MEEKIIKNKRQGINIYKQVDNKTLLIIKSKKFGDIEFMVDANIANVLMYYHWNARLYRNSFYAYALKDNKYIALHRMITNCPKGLMVDHINHNTLDNRKQNLRICTNSENQHNQKHIKGIRKTNWGYQIQMRVGGKLKCFGTYKTFEEAKQEKIKIEKEYRPYVTEIKKYE